MANRPLMAEVHRRLRPETYLEIGVDKGRTLALARCRAIGIDPAYTVVAELDGDFALIRTSSDEFFARPDPLAVTGGRPFDFTFIDGLHVFEFALRDFAHAERLGTPRTLHIVDDVLPRSVDEAARDRHTGMWAGDVFRVIAVLRERRPDLFLLPLTTTPTGSLLVFGADPTNTVLFDDYAAIMARHRRTDPQVLAPDLAERISTVTPDRFLSTRVLEVLADREVSDTERRSALAEEVRRLGEGFVPTDLA